MRTCSGPRRTRCVPTADLNLAMTTTQVQPRRARLRTTGLSGLGAASLLLEWDAIGAGVPDDEYDCMIWPLYELIRQRSSCDEIAAWVRDYRRDHFGLEDEGDSDVKLAERLLAAFTDQ